MTINNVTLKYLEHYYLPRIVNQYKIQSREQDPVSDAANTAIISGVSATVTNIFQFVIPQGIPKITIGTPSFAFLTQNLTLAIFSIVFGVFALGRFKQSMDLAEDFCEENMKVLTSIHQWNILLQEGLAEDIVEVAQLQFCIDTNNLQSTKINLVCFILAIGLITTNVLFSSLSLELLAMGTVYAMISTLMFFAYNLGAHWDDNVINRKRMEALQVNHIITKLHNVIYPNQGEKRYNPQKINVSIEGKDVRIPICPMRSESDIPLYRIVV